MNETIHIIYDDTRKKRVEIFRRPDNSFGFEEEYFSDYESEKCWLPRGRNISFFDTFEVAVREAYSRISWLSGKEASPAPPLLT